MGELILMRHGETSWSRSGRHTSHTDLPLTPRGEDQARALAPLLSARRLALVLVSPLARAVRTAQLAGLTGLTTEENLHEWDYGGYEGITTDEIHRERPGWNMWTDGVVPGPEHKGESPTQVGERADRVIERALQRMREEEGDVVLVAHSHILRVLTARYLGLPPSAGSLFLLGTGALSRLGTEHDRPVITAWNATAGQASG
jgi:broad specificity phosphatase PhoE